MLSILIPTYNYNITALVKVLHQQALDTNRVFEILVFDDGSELYHEENKAINALEYTSYTILKKNIGRSAIRNLLAKQAQFENLLFLDADVFIIENDFIKTYLGALSNETGIIYGGIVYCSNPPDNSKILRWTYGKKREALDLEERIKNPYLRFLTLNFLIKKELFTTIKFNEDIPNLRHEDTLFAMDTKSRNINIKHIDNAVEHLGLESNDQFLKKSLESVDGLKLMIDKRLINPDDVALSKVAMIIQNSYMSGLVTWFIRSFKKSIKKNLLSNKPSLVLFDLYRLGYYYNSDLYKN